MQLGGRPMEEWVERYGHSHRHPVNRVCHAFGIPLIAISLPLWLVIPFAPGFWPLPAAMFTVGWILQFAGHAVEGKPPEFFKDWRFLLVGLRWWFAKVLRS
ncbi:MAG TPA: Mpo1-like protein [Vicinamibacterales bacterium]|nr:Mpo1-like protein [Vicinamibacterales bacterium]